MGRGTDVVVVLVRGEVEVASWLVGDGGHGDLSLVDRLARLQLAAGRLGCAVRLRAPSDDLVALLDLVGLGGVVPAAGLGEVGGEPEGGEERGVEEVVVADDPVA